MKSEQNFLLKSKRYIKKPINKPTIQTKHKSMYSLPGNNIIYTDGTQDSRLDSF